MPRAFDARRFGPGEDPFLDELDSVIAENSHGDGTYVIPEQRPVFVDPSSLIDQRPSPVEHTRPSDLKPLPRVLEPYQPPQAFEVDGVYYDPQQERQR